MAAIINHPISISDLLAAKRLLAGSRIGAGLVWQSCARRAGNAMMSNSRANEARLL